MAKQAKSIEGENVIIGGEMAMHLGQLLLTIIWSKLHLPVIKKVRRAAKKFLHLITTELVSLWIISHTKERSKVDRINETTSVSDSSSSKAQIYKKNLEAETGCL